jgi:L-alanine-DL-glutamate epimerase-like enolase superfamily enzyme
LCCLSATLVAPSTPISSPACGSGWPRRSPRRWDIEVRDGLVHAINRPGLGAAIDFDLIEKKKITVLR